MISYTVLSLFPARDYHGDVFPFTPITPIITTTTLTQDCMRIIALFYTDFGKWEHLVCHEGDDHRDDPKKCRLTCCQSRRKLAKAYTPAAPSSLRVRCPCTAAWEAKMVGAPAHPPLHCPFTWSCPFLEFPVPRPTPKPWRALSSKPSCADHMTCGRSTGQRYLIPCTK